MAQRPPLTLTAELEKLEQSITLTLQEIDHNFSKTHRIVTNSIIPIVERYAKESTAVWEGSKFWKQFFEASANVALSNYQEEEEQQEPTYGEPTTVADGTTYVTHDSSAFPNSSPANYERSRAGAGAAAPGDDDETVHTTATTEPRGDVDSDDDDDGDDYLLDDSMLDSLDLTGVIPRHSTPKAKKPGRQQQPRAQQWANIESPFEALKKELITADHTYNFPAGDDHDHTNDSGGGDASDDSILLPSTPPTNRSRQYQRRAPPPPPGADPETPTTSSSPFLPPPYTGGGGRKTPGDPKADALLHRVLDKNWRVQATPLGKAPASKYRTAAGAATPKSTRRLFAHVRLDDDDSDDDRSPEKPQLHTKHMFSSPAAPGGHLNLGPKTPTTAAKGKKALDAWDNEDEDEDEDDDDDILGYSPPQTIQFSFPQSKLLATPAREASRRIVKDILRTAGAGDISASQGGDSFSSPPFVSGKGASRWGDSDEDIF